MVQVHTCVSVHCYQCGNSLGSAGFEVHYPTQDAALDAAAAQGWRVGPGGRLWCSACAPVLTCEAEGHKFSEWRHPVTSDGQPAGNSEYRHCQRCCLHESRPDRRLISSRAGQGKSAALPSELLAGAGTTAGEVA
jgi:hypothetical protein